MKSLQKRRSTALILAVAWLAVCLVLTLAMGQTKATEDYEIKLLAAQKLQGWMDDIRDYKLEAGLSLTPYDTHKTGMIGDEYTPITTSLGSGGGEADPQQTRTWPHCWCRCLPRPG